MRFPKSIQLGVVAASVATTSAFGISLDLIPEISGDAVSVTMQGFATTPDGKFVVGIAGSRGFVYQTYGAGFGTTYNVLGGGAQATTANGVGYRTSGGNTELLISGFSSGFPTEWMTTDGGATFTGRRRNASMPGTPQMGTANQLGSQLGSDIYYVSSSRNASGQPVYLNQGSGAWGASGPAVFTWDNKGITSPSSSIMRGVSAIGRAVGRRGSSGANDQAYVMDWVSGTPSAYFINTLNDGLNGGNLQMGEAWSVSQNGVAVFGRSFLTGTSGDLYSFKTTIAGFAGTHAQGAVNRLPELAGTGGSTGRTTPYGASADGRYAVGMDYLGIEKAALWDTGDGNPLNWTVMDLTQYAIDRGIIGNWLRLARAYSVGVDPLTGDPIVTGQGVWSPDGGATLYTRAWVMQIPEPSSLSLLALGGLAALVARRRK